MKRLLITLLCVSGLGAAAKPFALPPPHEGVAVAASGTRVVVAHDHVIELFDRGRALWKSDGVETPTAIAVSDTQAAVIDQLRDQVAIADLASGKTRFVKTLSSPVAAAFAGRDLLVIDRDASAVERFSADGTSTSLQLAPDPAFIAVAGERAYVYSRVAGVLQEIVLSPFALARTAPVAPFASAMVVAANAAYLTYPHEARLRVVDVAVMGARKAEEVRVGAVPIDLALAAEPTPLTPRLLAVADPASKRVWIIEARQSATQAFGRAFIRGLLGMNAFSGRDAAFPTGVDRVAAHEGKYLAFDSSTGTLYRVSSDTSTQLATALGPRAFALTSDGTAVWWQNGTLVAKKLA